LDPIQVILAWGTRSDTWTARLGRLAVIVFSRGERKLRRDEDDEHRE
jgi:hypothetical protein